MNSIKRLNRRIHELHALGAYHKKRGFSLKEAKLSTASNHLIEEATELQAEMLDGDSATQVEEAADVLLVYLHLLRISNLTLKDVVKFARQKLERNFTLDKSEVLTDTPGYSRKNRNEKAGMDNPFGYISDPDPRDLQ